MRNLIIFGPGQKPPNFSIDSLLQNGAHVGTSDAILEGFLMICDLWKLRNIFSGTTVVTDVRFWFRIALTGNAFGEVKVTILDFH